MSSGPLTSAPHTDARSPRTARSKHWMIFRKYPTYRLPSAYRWYSVPTKRPEAKQAHAPEIFAIPAEDLREDKKSSQYLPSWDFRLFSPKGTLETGGAAIGDRGLGEIGDRGVGVLREALTHIRTDAAADTSRTIDGPGARRSDDASFGWGGQAAAIFTLRGCNITARPPCTASASKCRAWPT
eukprot:scaffold2215_cov153-Isochrysis_galbana.AAC.1